MHSEETLIGEGMQSHVFLRAGEAIKRFRPGYPTVWAYYEGMVTSMAAQAGLPVAHVHGIDSTQTQVELRLDYLPGGTLDQQMQQNPAEAPSSVQVLLDLQTRIHATPLPLSRRWSNQLAEQLRSQPGLGNACRQRLLDQLASLPDGIACCHGDFYGGNVLCSAGQHYVIDWINVCLGHPSADFARTLLTYQLHAPAVAALYQAALQAGGQDQTLIAQWLPVLAATRLAENVPGEHEHLLALIENC